MFETLYVDEAGGLDTVDIDNLHLIPKPCPATGGIVSSILICQPVRSSACTGLRYANMPDNHFR